MTLLELLVQELPKRGGWPDNGIAALNHPSGLVGFYIRAEKPILMKDLKFTGAGWVTRKQYEAALAASKQPEWDGAGLPPVGEVIEYSCIFFNPNRPAIEKGQWYKGTVIAYYDDCVWTSDNGIRPLDNTQFRPIRTEAERKREEVGLAIYHAINFNAEGELASPSRMEDYRKAYDAIAAGKIPGIKLDN